MAHHARQQQNRATAVAGSVAGSVHVVRRCERAVVTAYRELREAGNGDLSAFAACAALYRIHHPEASVAEARWLVAEWIDHHVIRGDDGPTAGCDCG
jgi:hypothetical protein